MLQDLAGSLGAVAYHYYDTPQTVAYAGGRVEVETDGDYTVFGYILFTLCIAISTWIGHAIHNGSVCEAFSPKETILFFAWLYPLLILVIVTGMSNLAFRGGEGFWANLIHSFIDLGAIFGVARVSYLWCKGKTADL